MDTIVPASGAAAVIVQIYAFTLAEQAVRAAEQGVDHIGMVVGNYGLVHGEIGFAQAREIVLALPASARAVALTMSNEVAEISRMASAVHPAVVHISTDLMAVPPAAMVELRRSLAPDVQLMKAIPVNGSQTLAQAAEFEPVCDYLLLDTKVDGMPGVGATGRTHDWSISRQLADKWPQKVILAGGLTPGNVGAAIEAVRPLGVDSNSGTNVQGEPLAKDFARIEAFVSAAKTAGAGAPR